MLALLAVLADSHLAYRGTLTDMCDFLGVASRNSRTNNKIKDAIDALETDGLLKKITDGRTFTLTLSKKAEKERRVIRIQKEWVMVAKNYANLPGKSESVGWMPLLKVWLYLIDCGKSKYTVTLDTVIDQFGKEVWLSKVDDWHFQVTVTVAVSPQFLPGCLVWGTT